MNIYDFINSADIREYWEKIGYEPDAPAAAWIVWQSENHTLKEKHQAWQEIIDTQPDWTRYGELDDVPQESLHGFLRQYMDIESRLLSDFYKNEPNVIYHYRFYSTGAEGWCYESAFFPTFDKMYSAAVKEHPISPNFEYIKTYIGDAGKRISLRMNCNGEVLFVKEEQYLTADEEIDTFCEAWYEMSFDLPTPFKKGDIVEMARGKYTPSFDEPFVFISVYTEPRENGNGSVTLAHGYSVDKSGVAQPEWIYNYINLEYAKELSPANQPLLSISNLVKEI